MAELRIDSSRGGMKNLLIEFSTGYMYRFNRENIGSKIRIMPDGHLVPDRWYQITKVKINKRRGGEQCTPGFWWLGGPRTNYELRFQNLIDEIAPGYLGRNVVMSQIIAERMLE